jgi:hypothetical protein
MPKSVTTSSSQAEVRSAEDTVDSNCSTNAALGEEFVIGQKPSIQYSDFAVFAQSFRGEIRLVPQKH